jgi:sarcosine oxidase subunit gamma
MAEPVALTPQSAFAPHLQSVGPASHAGVIVRDRADLQIATVVAFNDRKTLARRVRAAYDLDLADGPRRTASQDLIFVGTGPGTWLAVREGGGSLADDLRRSLGPCAAVADQSSGYAVLHVSGAKVRDAFEKGFMIDLHPRAFRPGDAAVTNCAHIGAVLWQLDDAPSYEVAVFRSLAASFWHWLSESAAVYGIRVEGGAA